MIHGHWYPATRSEPAWEVPPESFVSRLDDRMHHPCWELVRSWCGAEAVARVDELSALRHEVRRLGDLIEEAIKVLRRAGQKIEADRLQRALGVAVEDLRS
jgi:hypothetical protein